MRKQSTHKPRSGKFNVKRAMLALSLVFALVLPHGNAIANTASPAVNPELVTDDSTNPIDVTKGFNGLSPDLINSIIIEEDISKRGEYEKHFLCDDGSFIAISYPEPVHKKQGNEWVDAKLPFAIEGNRVTSDLQDAAVSLARTTTFPKTDGLVTFDTGEHMLRWIIKETNSGGNQQSIVEGITASIKSVDTSKVRINARNYRRIADSLIKQKKAVLSGMETVNARSMSQNLTHQTAALNDAIEDANRNFILDISTERAEIEYPGVMGDGTTLKYVLKPGSIKENLELAYRGDFVSYTSQINSDGLKAELQADNSILLNNDAGDTVATISSPYMYDYVGEDSSAFTVTVVQNGNDLEITYTPDAAWLDASERVWPVVIDPEIACDSTGIVTNKQIDNYIYSGQGETIVSNTSKNLYVGYKSGVEHRSYWRLADLPRNAKGYTITSASFNARFLDGTSTMGSGGIELYRVTGTWESDTIKWSKPPTNDSVRLDVKNTLPASSTNGRWMVFNEVEVKKLVEKWYSGDAGNHGFMLKYAQNVADYNVFYSADNGTGYFPYLEVKYQNSPPATISNYTVPSIATVGDTVKLSATVTGKNVSHGYWVIRKPDNTYLDHAVVYNNDKTKPTFTYTFKATDVGTYTIDFGTRDDNGVCWATERKMTVGAVPTGVTLSPTSLSLDAYATSTTKLTATVSPSNAANKDVNWTSSNISIAYRNSTGEIKAGYPGTATISCTTEVGGKSPATPCTVTVKPTTYTTMKVGDTYKGTITAGRHFWYTFTPTYSGKHSFETTGSTDTFGVLYQGTTQLDAKSSGGEGSNFRLEKSLKAGVEYRLKVQGNFTTTTGNFTVKVTAWPHATKPTIRERSEWGAVPLDDSKKVERTRPPERVFFHHSAQNFTSTDLDATKKEIKRIQKMHMDGDKLQGKPPKSDIAYHFVIDPAGRIWVGAELDNYMRGHTGGYMDDIAVLLLGDFERSSIFSSVNKLNDAQKAAMESIAKWLCYEYNLQRIITGNDIAPISTHKTVTDTQCPGKEAASWIEGELRTFINNWGS